MQGTKSFTVLLFTTLVFTIIGFYPVSVESLAQTEAKDKVNFHPVNLVIFHDVGEGYKSNLVKLIDHVKKTYQGMNQTIGKLTFISASESRSEQEICTELSKHFNESESKPDIVLDFSLNIGTSSLIKKVVRFLEIPALSIMHSYPENNPWKNLTKFEQTLFLQTYSPIQLLNLIANSIYFKQLHQTRQVTYDSLNHFVYNTNINHNETDLPQYFRCGTTQILQKDLECFEKLNKTLGVQNLFLADDYPNNPINFNQMFPKCKQNSNSNLEKYFSDHFAWFTMSLNDTGSNCEECSDIVKLVHIYPNYAKMYYNKTKTNIMDDFLIQVVHTAVAAIWHMKSNDTWFQGNTRLNNLKSCKNINSNANAQNKLATTNSNEQLYNEKSNFVGIFSKHINEDDNGGDVSVIQSRDGPTEIEPQLYFNVDLITRNKRTLIGTVDYPQYSLQIDDRKSWNSHRAMTHVKVALVIDPPFLMKKSSCTPELANNITCYHGVVIDILQKFEEHQIFKFSYKLYDTYAGAKDAKTKTFGGAIKAINSTEVNMGAMFMEVTKNRSEVVEFLTGYLDIKQSNRTFGIPISRDSNLKPQIERLLFKLKNQKWMEQVSEKWFVENPCECSQYIEPETMKNQCTAAKCQS